MTYPFHSDHPAHLALPGDVLHVSAELFDPDTGHDLPLGFYVLCEQVKGMRGGAGGSEAGAVAKEDMLLLAAAGNPDDLGPWADPDRAEEMDAAVEAAKADGCHLKADRSATWGEPVALLWSPE